MNAPWKANQAGGREAFTAFVCDDLTLDTIRGVCDEMGWNESAANKGGLRNAIQSLSVSASPQILLVDLSESGDPINDINELAEVCEPGTVVIALGQVNDVRLYRDLLMSGLQDYLLKPLSPDAVRDALAQAQAALMTPKLDEAGGDKPHVSTAVVGVRGGVGASTIATSLAWLFSEKLDHSTGLLDLDIHFGTGALSMDLEPGRGLTDAIDNPSRIDGLFIERAMIKANDKLSILSAECPMNSPIMSDGSAFFQLQEELRAAFENTVIDCPRSMLISYPHLANDINVMVVTTELTLAAARDTIRVLSWAKANAPHSKILVVANKVNGAGAEISRKDFEATIESKIDLVIPADPKATAQAAKLGRPIVESVKSSKISLAIANLADMITDAAQQEVEDSEGGEGKTKKKSVVDGFKSMLSKKEK